ncbi:MAG: formylglycine-generating enzyme family protein [Paracoccaceae bacterium]
MPGGSALLGTNAPQIPDDGESPLREKRLTPFEIGAATVTNQEFLEFVDATDYVTEAETFGWSFVFWSDLPEDAQATLGVEGVEWWRKVDGANWKDICGPESQADAWFPDHPVVHVSWNDAQAYARWAGGRLPTETEWEHAARGGQGDVRFPWGDLEPDDSEVLPCNIWQGRFPHQNTIADGWKSTAPSRSYDPNELGLYNMVGNVWEWTSDAYKVKSLKKSVRSRLEGMRGFKVLKGGSFLCHRSYCYRYRIAARSGNSPDSTTTHQGFRIVWDV